MQKVHNKVWSKLVLRMRCNELRHLQIGNTEKEQRGAEGNGAVSLPRSVNALLRLCSRVSLVLNFRRFGL